MKCRKCGGSGDMFVLQSIDNKNRLPQQRVENWEWYQEHQGEWQVIGNIECSLCGGLGAEER